MTISTGKSVLDTIVAHKREEVASRKKQRSFADLAQAVMPCPPNQLEAAFRQNGPAAPLITKIMLEIKPASPSAGILAPNLDLSGILPAYNQYGIAISVLTDAHFFGGSLDLLSQVAKQTPHPVLCKDFIIDPYQVYEARLAGAAAVLLIVKSLEDAQLAELMDVSRSLGLTPLVEVQTEDEVERALQFNPSILLINNRNLQTLEMDMKTTTRLSGRIPKDILRISASGIESRADIERIQPFCDGFLIGSAMMRQPADKLADALQELTRA